MAFAAVAQSVPWANDLLPYYHGTAVAPNNDLLRNKMAASLLERPQDAEGPLCRAVELRPDAAGYHYALGAVLRQQGKQDEAAAESRAEAANRKRVDEQMKALGLDVVQ